jgi:hypothetical protein
MLRWAKSTFRRGECKHGEPKAISVTDCMISKYNLRRCSPWYPSARLGACPFNKFRASSEPIRLTLRVNSAQGTGQSQFSSRSTEDRSLKTDGRRQKIEVRPFEKLSAGLGFAVGVFFTESSAIAMISNAYGVQHLAYTQTHDALSIYAYALLRETSHEIRATSSGRCSSTVEHSFRKAGVEGPNPSIGFMTIHGNDTPKEISDIQYGLYRNMSPAKKITLLFDAYHTGRILAMAGIRMLKPSATEAEIRQIWARQHLGEKLFSEVYGNVRNG